jgi:hypothetical protein
MMKLSNAQVRSLIHLQKSREDGFTYGRFIRANWRAYLLCVGVMGACAILVWHGLDMPIVATGIVGVLIGTLLRDLGWMRRLKQGWPLSLAITDWNQVALLIEQNREQ